MENVRVNFFSLRLQTFKEEILPIFTAQFKELVKISAKQLRKTLPTMPKISSLFEHFTK